MRNMSAEFSRDAEIQKIIQSILQRSMIVHWLDSDSYSSCLQKKLSFSKIYRAKRKKPK